MEHHQGLRSLTISSLYPEKFSDLKTSSLSVWAHHLSFLSLSLGHFMSGSRFLHSTISGLWSYWFPGRRMGCHTVKHSWKDRKIKPPKRRESQRRTQEKRTYGDSILPGLTKWCSEKAQQVRLWLEWRHLNISYFGSIHAPAHCNHRPEWTHRPPRGSQLYHPFEDPSF